DEVVAVVVTGLPTNGEWNFGLFARLLQHLRAQLLGKKGVGVAVIDQKLRKSRTIFDERDGIMFAPDLLVFAKIASQRLDAPRNLGWRHDWRKGAGRAVAVGKAQRDGQRTMAAHGMAEDGSPCRIDRKMLGHQSWQLFGDITPHAVVSCEGRL